MAAFKLVITSKGVSMVAAAYAPNDSRAQQGMSERNRMDEFEARA